MQTLIAKDQKDWVGLAWEWIHREVGPGERVFIPAGGTPTPLYRGFCRSPSALWRSLRLVQLDEIIGGPKQGLFRHYFEAELAPFTAQIEWISAADATADVAILGVGLNGHVAFHEPGLPRDFRGGCVPLSAETLAHLGLAQPTWGVTYGVGTFLQAKKILVLAQGPAKQKTIRRALAGEELPVKWILEHREVTLICDFPLKEIELTC